MWSFRLSTIHPLPPPLHTSGIGVVPKKSGGHRLIMHLSAPAGNSVNDFIDSNAFSFSTISVDTVCDHVRRIGRGALLCKVDLRHAFRLIPVHPDDRPLLGMFWRGKFYLDLVLPFGLRSSPPIFNRFADTLAWILRVNYSIFNIGHYLDDFINVSPPSASIPTSTAALQMSTILQVFENLGVPVAEGLDKVAGPLTTLTVLGLEIDTIAMEIRLPASKFLEIQHLLARWRITSSCVKRELLSLIGLLSFAAKVVAAGRTFLRRLIDFSSSASGLSDIVALTTEAQEDILWWQEMLPLWNGKACIRDHRWSKAADMELFADASGLGSGGFFQGQWFRGTWKEFNAPQPSASIIWREMVPVAVAYACWGHRWSGKKILLHCDNSSVLEAWKAGSCWHPGVVRLIRKSLHVAALNNFITLITHIPGINNSIADALSRGQLARFRSLAPAADYFPQTLQVF